MQYYTIPGITNFAEAYGVGSYSECAYGENCTASTSTSPLADTGVRIGLFVGIACLLLLIVVLVRFWRRSSRKAEPVRVAVDDDLPPIQPTEKNIREDD